MPIDDDDGLPPYRDSHVYREPDDEDEGEEPERDETLHGGQMLDIVAARTFPDEAALVQFLNQFAEPVDPEKVYKVQPPPSWQLTLETADGALHTLIIYHGQEYRPSGRGFQFKIVKPNMESLKFACEHMPESFHAGVTDSVAKRVRALLEKPQD